MWLENLKELKKRTGMSVKQIADKANLPERTVARIISGETDHPRIDTLGLIVDAVGGSMQDVFADTNVIVATEKLVESKEVVEAERDEAEVKNEMLEAKITALTMEVELLKKDIQHRDELLAVHKQYLAIIKSNIRVEE